MKSPDPFRRRRARMHPAFASATAAVVLLLLTAPQSNGAVVRRGESVPIHLNAEHLAEAEKPLADPSDSGGGFWNPGPERFYGWALRDLRDYLRKMTGAEFPFT